jgi:transcription elongation factor Elf1
MFKNKYQTWSDYWNARWTCPKCKHTVRKLSMCDNLSLATIENKKTSYRLECVHCGFTEQLEPFEISARTMWVIIEYVFLFIEIIGLLIQNTTLVPCSLLFILICAVFVWFAPDDVEWREWIVLTSDRILIKLHMIS